MSETLSALLPFEDDTPAGEADFEPFVAASVSTRRSQSQGHDHSNGYGSVPAMPATADEDVGAFKPSTALAAAIDDAKLLVVSFHTTEPSNLLAWTWYLTREGVPCEGQSCPMHLSGRAGKETFNTVIGADERGRWSAVQAGAAATKTYRSLHLALHDQLKALLKRGRHQLPAQAHRYEYVRPAAEVESREEDNAAVYHKYLDAPGPDALFSIHPAPFPQPHVVVCTLDTRGGSRYVLGYHPASAMWFLADPEEVWATVSESLPALLSTVVESGPE